MDVCLMTYTPLIGVLWGLLDVGFNATDGNVETLLKPIEANATFPKKGQCKS